MKKLIMAVAMVCTAAMVQASNVSWKLTSVGDYAGKNVYAFNTAEQATILATLTAGGSTIADYIAGNSLNIGGVAAAVTGSGDRAKASATATGVDTDKNIFFVIFDGEIKDGGTYSYSAGADATGYTFEEGDKSPGTLSIAYAAVKSGQMIGNVPEPTSGLLLLLGVAGLALRRRRA